MQSFKWKFENQSFRYPSGGPRHLFKNTVKVQYLRNNRVRARAFFRLFITHLDLHNVYSLASKAIEQLVIFPRQFHTKLESYVGLYF
jgi:hypothetical protein